MSKSVFFAIGTVVGFLQTLIGMSVTKNLGFVFGLLASWLVYQVCEHITIYFDEKITKDLQDGKETK